MFLRFFYILFFNIFSSLCSVFFFILILFGGSKLFRWNMIKVKEILLNELWVNVYEDNVELGEDGFFGKVIFDLFFW